jgi:hypothetical protein
MHDQTIHLLEPTPTLHSKKCKLLALLLQLFLQYTTLVATALIWYLYDIVFALLGAVLLFIIMGIIRSKLRNISIPLNQREYQYNDEGIAKWYVAKELCYEEMQNKSHP